MAYESEQDEKRYLQVEFRVEGIEEPKIVGYASVFGQKSEDLGGFTEIVRPGAFRKTIKESDVRALLNHDPNYVLGRNKSGTLELKEDSTGLKMTITPPDTQWARDLMTSIKRGDIDQASFGFRTVKDEWRTEDGKQIRELVEAKLFDVSVVTQPAYPQTSVAVRSKVEELTKILAEPPEDEHSVTEPAKNRHSHEAELKRIDKVIFENIELEGLNGKSK